MKLLNMSTLGRRFVKRDIELLKKHKINFYEGYGCAAVDNNDFNKARRLLTGHKLLV